MLNPIAKWLVIAGLLLVVFGLLWQVIGKHIPFGRLPGDIVIERENMRVYFPIVSMVIVSIVLSVIFSLFRFFR